MIPEGDTGERSVKAWVLLRSDGLIPEFPATHHDSGYTRYRTMLFVRRE